MTKTSKKKKFRGRSAVLFAAVLAAAAAFGTLSGCSDDSTTETDDEKTTSNPDTQVIKNGNFEYYEDGDGVYLISSPDSWSRTSSGTSSYTMSGVINTKQSKWDEMSDENLYDTLVANEELADNYADDPDTYEDEYDSDYVDYNGMSYYDIPYANVAAALDYYDADDDDEKDENDIALISNPLTHNVVKTGGTTGYYYEDENGDTVDLYIDENGDYFYDADFEEPFETSVLMIHNYLKNRNGTGQYYASSTTVTLEASTAAEISVWVKTSDLYYRGGESVVQNRGAYIEVEQTVGSTSLDSFIIKDINTEKLNPDGDNNGWVQYTIYVQACDYAETTVTINLGLGESGAYAVEGYAFFDDLVCTKYASVNETSISSANLKVDNDNKYVYKDDGGTYCSLLSEGDEKVFEADTYSAAYEGAPGSSNVDFRFSENYYYYIDLMASNDHVPVTLSSTNLTMGATKDDNNYVVSSSQPTITGSANSVDLGTYYVNNDLTRIVTTYDILANLNITSATSISDALSGSYVQLLSDALTSAKDLPLATSTTNTVIMLSAMGAPYTATITDDSFKVAAGEYLIVTLWVKTSDMNGGTAATINLIDDNDDENVATLTVDTTGVTTDIDDDNEDIYDGWVQCFFYIQNDTEDEQSFTIEYKFGDDTIKDTTVSAYRAGWVAFSNLQTFPITETEYGYADSTDYTSTLTFSVTDDRSSNQFTSASYEADIEDNITNPSGYNGVNGASATIISGDGVTAYDDKDSNNYAGLINVDYFGDYLTALQTELDENGLTTDYAWLKSLIAQAGYSLTDAVADADAVWKAIFGADCVQPLLIVNSLRTYAIEQEVELDQTAIDSGNYYYYDTSSGTYKRATTYDENETYYTLKQAINYGYVSSETTLSSEEYTAITVRVKVSGDAVAYIYLTDTTSERDVMSYEIPDYTFWYDEDGNVLKTEPDEDDDYDAVANIAYTLRTDGLYEDDEDNLYANLYSLTRTYYNENLEYYDKDGNAVSYENLEENGEYYTSSACTTYVAHRLVSSDGTRVFEYSGEGVGTSAYYYYYVDDAYDTSLKVRTFDTSVATPRYTSGDSSQYAYSFKITNTNGEWATVSFLVYTGSESKSYRLELWSGERDQSGVTTTDLGNEVTLADYTDGDGYVIFDYSYVSLDEDTYTALMSEYTDKLIEAYRDKLTAAVSGITFASYDENLDYYRQLAEDNGVDCSDIEDYYTALYYTYTLYDSASYVPFNEDAADDDETGYDYSISDYEEVLAYFSYIDESSNTYTMFIDYSAVDQSIDIGTTSDEDEEEEETESDTNIGLLITSIVLVIALLLTLISMLVRELVKKIRRRRNIKHLSRNQYTKRKRYIRQYTKANGEVETAGNAGEADEAQNANAETDTPADTSEGSDENKDE